MRVDDGPRLTPSDPKAGAADGVTGDAAAEGAPVVFFDGYCGLCNAFVDFTIARDRRARFRFAPLQGETAVRLVPEDAVIPEAGDAVSVAPRSVVLLENGFAYRRSEAALRVLSGLGGAWRAANLLRVVPRPVRDFVYDFIARRRYRWFGRRAACRMPGPGERGRFLP